MLPPYPCALDIQKSSTFSSIHLTVFIKSGMYHTEGLEGGKRCPSRGERVNAMDFDPARSTSSNLGHSIHRMELYLLPIDIM